MTEYTIPVTEYLLPDGFQTYKQIPVNMDVWSKATELMYAGYCFEMETLRSGSVSVTIADPALEEDVDIEIGPKDQTEQLFERMILRYTEGK
jgi:hypothetical protein